MLAQIRQSHRFGKVLVNVVARALHRQAPGGTCFAILA
jgi:hypothetical protein